MKRKRRSVSCPGLGALLLLALLPLPLQAGAARVLINEVHYHPADDLRDGEFIELFNFGSEPADISRWSVVGGIEFTFPPGTVLQPNSDLVLAANKAALEARYHFDPKTLFGDYAGSLSNDRDNLELWTADGYLMLSSSTARSSPMGRVTTTEGSVTGEAPRGTAIPCPTAYSLTTMWTSTESSAST